MLKRRLPLVLLILLVSIVAFAGHGGGKQVRYVGPHPIPKEFGGGYCHIQVPHVHVYVPVNAKLEYRDDDDGYQFVGDPEAYGWDGPKYAYYGHHPIETADGHVEYCYIDGPHYHDYAPPEDEQFTLEGGAYWYVGDFPQAYVDARADLDPIDTVYVKEHYDRPVVVVDSPPTAWVGLRYTAPHATVAVGVEAPVVVEPAPAHIVAGVQVTAPSLEVEVGVPTVVVGGGVIVEHDHRWHDDDDHHWHHDNGWHRGWHKRGKHW